MASSDLPLDNSRDDVEGERREEKREGDGRGGFRCAAFDLAKDVDGGGEGLERDVAGDDDDGSELADGATKTPNARGDRRGKDNREVEDRKSTRLNSSHVRISYA